MVSASALVILAALAQTQGQKGDAAATKEPGIVALFNGKDLTGWVDALDNASEWSVTADGILEGRGGGVGHPAVLVTERQDFVNYRLRVTFGFTEPVGGAVEVRRSGEADTTSCYRVSACVSTSPMAKERPAGHLSRLVAYRYGSTMPPARPVANRPPVLVNQWHTLEIIVNGNRITTAVDGQQVDDFVDRKKSPQPGGIALVCGGPAMIRIRDIQIQELPAK